MEKTLEYYLSLPYRLEIVPDTEEGGYGARYPKLPGCVTCAETMESIIANAENAKQEGVSMNQYCLYLLAKNDTAHSVRTQ